MEETRAAIKAQAKANFKANYGVCVGIIIVCSIIMAGLSAPTFGAAAILIGIPVELGLICHFTLVYFGGTPEFSTTFSMGFGGNYGRKIGGMLWMALWVFLWSMLFVIPGIVKAYEYYLTPYILANYPEVKAKEALNLSKRIMQGNKAEMFIFDLSFLGWHILGAFTAGILEFLYVTPYYYTAQAGYCSEMIDRAVRNGIVLPSELNPGE